MHSDVYTWQLFGRLTAVTSVNRSIVNRGELVMKPGKHQKSKQRCQDLGWYVGDPAQSFVLPSYTMHELRNQHVSIG